MKILSFGEMLWDVYTDSALIGGAPLNLAAHAALQGAEAWAVTGLGTDELGEKALSIVKDFGINTDYITICNEKPTGRCLVTFDENSVPSYNLLDDTAYDFIKTPNIEDESFDVLAFGTLSLRHENNIRTIKEIISMGVCKNIYCDLNIRPPFYSEDTIRLCLENATIAKISDEELPVVLDAIGMKEKSVNNAMPILAEKYPQLKLILITCGEKGAFLYNTTEKKEYYTPVTKTEFVSAVGAGDSFGATFLVALHDGKSIPDCLSIASKVSAFVVSKADAVPKYDINNF